MKNEILYAIISIALALLLLCIVAPYSHAGPLKAEDVPVLKIDKDGKIECKDVDKILEALTFYIVQCGADTCGVFKPLENQKAFKDEYGSEYYKVYKGDYIGLEKRK